jgi:hypothetical protein
MLSLSKQPPVDVTPRFKDGQCIGDSQQQIFPDFVGRDNSMKTLLCAFYERFYLLASTPQIDTKHSSDFMRKVNGYYGSSGAPGSGKTRFSEEIANLQNHPERVKQLLADNKVACDDVLFLEMISCWTPILVTYNCGYEILDIDKTHPEAGLALRILFL